MKYLADNDFKNLSGAELKEAISKSIREKGNASLVGNMASQGTTPRQLTDLIVRDRNHPCIVIWGLLNEAETHKEQATVLMPKLLKTKIQKFSVEYEIKKVF